MDPIATNIQPQMITLAIVFGIAVLFVIIVNIKLRKANPLDKPRGILHIAEIGVSWVDGFVAKSLPKTWVPVFGAYIGTLAFLIFFGTIFSLTGLPAATSSFSLTLSFAFVTFMLIHVTSARKEGVAYFKRYLQPFPVFLPVNLMSMWAPLISLSVRLFANILAGSIIIALLYSALGFAAPAIMPLFHGYFDLFAGAIQTLVFILLTSLFIQGELPDEEVALVGKD